MHHIDYGDYNEVNYEDIRKMPDKLLKIPACAEKCGLAYVLGP